jgi:phosphinothricin acetyltransferase
LSILIRPIQATDLPAIVAILNPFIATTAITFDTDPYSAQTRRPWFNQFSDTGRYRCLVAEKLNGELIGYANSAPLRAKRAYDTSVEVSIYRSPDRSVPGLGSLLYGKLFESLRTEDIHRAHAVITLPNSASITLHEKFGFYEVGTLHEAGRKFDSYHNVFWMEKRF